MGILSRLLSRPSSEPDAAHLRRGRRGEEAARLHLVERGFKVLAANYRSGRGEIDLICREGDVVAFIEVKTRSSEERGRPSRAVKAERRRRLTRAALDYLRAARQPEVRIRFDIVEVLLNGEDVVEIRHLPNAFPMAKPYSYGH